jgi:DNA replication protein DnaC
VTIRTNDENKEKIEDNITLNSNNINIITDAPTTLDASDFQKYAIQLSKLIVNKNSTPRFTVGIYGGWGTGKTTLMQMMQNEINRNILITYTQYGLMLGDMKEKNILQ